MKLIKSSTIIFLTAIFILINTALSQVQFKVPIALSVGVSQDTLWVGVSGDGPGGLINDNTYGLDEDPNIFGPFGAWSESSAPPADPDGNRNRFVDIPGRTQINAEGGLFPFDFRGFNNSSQIDTFAIRIDGARAEESGAIIRWPSNLNLYGSSWRLYSRSGNTLTEVANMLTTTTYTFAPSFSINFAIIKVGAFAPSPGPTFAINTSSINFGVISAGSTVSQTVTVTNTGNLNTLLISNVSTPTYFSVSPTSASIAAGGSQVFTVSFTAPVAGGNYTGNVVFTHNGTGSPFNLSVSGTSRTQGGLLCLTQDQSVMDNSSAEGGFYKDTIQIVNYTGQPLKGLTFDLISRGKITLSPITLIGEFATNNWNLTTSTVRGQVMADGSSIDTVHVVLLATGNTVLNPTERAIIGVFGYNTVNINSVSASTTIELQNINGSAVDNNGWPLNAGLNTSYIQTITINNRSLWGDINADDQVDILDLILLTNHLAKKTQLTGSAFNRADIHPWTVGAPAPSPNGILDINDLVMLQNIILKNIYPSGQPKYKLMQNIIANVSTVENSKKVDALVTFFITSKGITVRLDNSCEVAGIQMDLKNIISNPTSIISPFNLAGYNLDNKTLRVVLVDKEAKTLPAGSHTIAEMPMEIMNYNEISVSNLKVGSSNAVLLSCNSIVKNESYQGEQTNLPKHFSLGQNYPNPFNPNTWITFSVPKTSKVQITIYNTLGQKVRTLVEENMDAGEKKVFFNGKDEKGNTLPSGTYFYQMSANGYSETKKMMLLK